MKNRQRMSCLCKQENICMSFLLHVSLRKSTPEIGVKFLVFFTFFINFFMITFIKSIIYCQTVPLDRLVMYVVKVVCQASLPSFLTWVSLTISCLDKCQRKGNCLFSSASLSLVGEITHWCMNLQGWQLLNYM